jgi:hypothetical protein
MAQNWQVSTGLIAYMAGTGSAQAALAGGFIDFYDGSAGIPATADAAALGTKILRLYNNAVGQPANTTGLTLDNPVSNAPDGVTLSKPAAEVWSGPGLATLQAAYARFVAPGDTGAASTTQRRIQGVCGLAGADINMLTLQITNGVVATMDSFSWTIPAN